MKITFLPLKVLLCFGLLALTFSACKRYPDPALIFEESMEKPFTKPRKVLLIVIDGASGPEVKKIMPANLSGMLEHSKYSWEAFADSRTKDGPSWINILTGRNAANLGIADSTLQAVEDPNADEHAEIPRYSTFLQRLLEGGVDQVSVAVSPWDNLIEKGLAYASQPILAANDEAVKDSVLAKMDMPGLGTVVVHFQGVNEAGIAHGFSSEQPGYTAAVEKVDGYVGEIIQALESREQYEREDWLVIITSNHGGIGNSYGGASFDERQVMTLYYHPDFISQEFFAPKLLPLTQLSGTLSDPTNALVPADQADLYNFGSSGAYTVQLKVRFHSRGSVWPAFFGKKSTSYNSANDPGWLFMLYDPASAPKWRPFIGGSTGGGPVSQLSDEELVLGQWHTLTMKIYEEEGKRLVAGYTNGVRHEGVFEITGRDLDNELPLTLGVMPGWVSTGPTFEVADIRIYNTALSDQVIASESCNTEVTASSPGYEHLIGYWPAADGSGRRLVNRAPMGVGRDFVFQKNNSWNLIPADFCPDPEAEEDPNTYFMQNTEIAPQIFYWMQIETSASWNIEGTVWLDRYEMEFIGVD